MSITSADVVEKNEPRPNTDLDFPPGAANPIETPGNSMNPHKTSAVQITLLMTAASISVFLAALDMTIVTTALPTISHSFDSVSGYIWVGSAFLLAAAASTPNWGKLSDIWGRKPILLLASAVFFLGCALSGASVSLPMLIVGRAVQGCGAGGLLTLVNIIIGDLFSQRERGKYYGIIGMVWATAAALGPVIGGSLTSNASWRWCFYINLPISGTAFFVIAFTLHLKTPKTPMLAGLKAIDWLGSLTITGGTVMLLLGLQFGGTTFPWSSPTVICLIVFGIITIILFVAIESSPFATYPLVPTHLYTSITNLATLFVVFFHGLAFTQGTYFLPMYFQSVLGASPLLSGIWLLPFGVALSLTAVAAGFFLNRTARYNPCIRAGLFVAVLGAGLFYDLPSSRVWAKIIAFQILAGIGLGANFQPPLVALQSHVSPQDNAAATASFTLARNVAAAISVVVGSVAFGNKMAAQQGMLRAALGDELAGLMAGGDAQANLFLVDGLSIAQQEVVRAALYKAVRMIWIETVSFSAAALVACLFISGKKLQDTHVEVRAGLEGEAERRRIALGARSKKGRDGENVAV